MLSPNVLHLSLDDSNHSPRASILNGMTQRGSMAISENRSVASAVPTPDRKLNVELTEICIEMLLFRGVFGDSQRVRRFGILVKWRPGTKLVRATTSGCSSKVMKNMERTVY
uniref:Uncharacterized protein n=1 Tax=Strigamia maritima TaxID=126957 RepID=T1J3N8_STRMM